MTQVPAHEFELSVFGAPRFTGGPVSEPTLTQQRILERLALSAGRSVQAEQLIEAVWDAEPPRHARAAIQNQISRIRRMWGDHVIETASDGYMLGVTTDAARLHELSTRAEILLKEGDPHGAFELAESIMPLCVSRPFTAIEHVDHVATIRRALSASCKGVENTRLAAGIALGRVVWAVHEAEKLTAEAPHDEHRQAILARSLALAGRRGDALAAIAAARRLLRTELGIEAGPLLAAVEDEILRPSAVGTTAHSLAFVGRENEMRVILASLARSGIVRVHGEHGSGVTRLLRETGSHLRTLGVRVAFVDAREHVDSAVSVLRAISEEACFDADESRGLIAGFPVAAAQASEAHPLAIVIDNADVIGPSARATLDAAAGPRTLLLIGAHGAGSAADADTRIVNVALESLDRAAVARLASITSGGPLSSADIDHLVAYSGGNPLALEILLSTHPNTRDTAFQDPGADAATRLGTLAIAFLNDLDPRARATVERAAVAGEGYPVEAFTDGAILMALPRNLITASDGQVQFRHGALREAMYFNIPPAQREELHAELGRAARAAGAPAALVARHLIAAGPLASGEATAACRAAANAAARQGAHADATQWLSHIVSAPSLTEIDRLTARINLGDEQRLSGDPRHLETLTQAVREALDIGNEELIADACFSLLQLGGTSASGAPLNGVEELIESALAVLTDTSARALVCGAASLASSLAGNAERTRALFDEAENAADDPITRARILPFAYMALGMPEDLDLRRSITEELREIARSGDDDIALFESWQLDYSVRLQEGDGAAAGHAVQQMGTLIDSVGDVGRRWALQFARAGIAHLKGDDEACEQHAFEASALFSPVSPSRAAAAFGGQLLALRIAQDRVGELAPLLSELVTSQPGVPAWHAAFALATDNLDDSAEHARLTLERAQPDLTWLAAHVVGGRAAVRIGDPALITQYITRLAPWSGRGVWQGTCSYGPVDTVLAILYRAVGDDDACVRHTQVAAAVATRLGTPFTHELHRTGLISG